MDLRQGLAMAAEQFQQVTEELQHVGFLEDFGIVADRQAARAPVRPGLKHPLRSCQYALKDISQILVLFRHPSKKTDPQAKPTREAVDHLGAQLRP
jgi:hypothetical protein